MALVVRIGTGYVGDSPTNFLRIVENPGDAMVFPDTPTRDAFLTARGAPAVVDTVNGISGQKNRGKRSNNE